MDDPSAIDQQPGRLDRFLRLFSDVQPGEGVTAVLLALNIFLILTAYYILKPVREALILGQGSAELKSYMSVGQVLLLAVIVPLYAKMVARLPRRKLINTVTVFFAGCLVVFFGLAQFELHLGIVFFLWIGIFNLMIVAQFWSFANDVYTPSEGERLFPIVAFGASLGAVLGARIAGLLIDPFGIYQLMLVAAGVLILSLVITNHVDKKEEGRLKSSALSQDGPIDENPPERPDEAPSPKGRAFRLVFQTRYLLLIAFMLMLLNWVNTTGEYILGSVVGDTAREAVASGQAGGLSIEEYIGKFYADFFRIVNLAGVLIQLFLVSRIIKYLGVGVGILILPCLSLGAYGLLAFYPVLSVVRWAKTAENSTDYSLNNTIRNMLFLPCTREQKYNAKQAIDSFFVRAGDVLTALLVFAGTTYLAMGPSGFAKFNIVLVLVWLGLAVLIGREYKRLIETGETPR